MAFALAVETADADRFFDLESSVHELVVAEALEFYRPQNLVNTSTLAYEDLNRDGLLDVLLYNAHLVAIFLNHGDGDYAPPIIFAAYDRWQDAAIRYMIFSSISRY